MPRYFFHSEDGGSYIDPDGVELADLAAARAEATRFLAEMLRDGGEALFRSGKLQLSVTDEGGGIVLVLSLTSAEPPSAVDGRDVRMRPGTRPDAPAAGAPPDAGGHDPYEVQDGGASRAAQAPAPDGGGADAGMTMDDPGRGGD